MPLSHSAQWAFKVKRTAVHPVTLAVLLILVLCAKPAFSSAKSLPAPFDATFLAYHQLSTDPRGTRDQWMRVVHSFAAIHRKSRSSQIGKRSLFFAGRSCLGLYRRSGKKADLDEAIRYLNEFVRTNRKGPYLILGLQELKEAHLLKRRRVAVREEHAPRPAFGNANRQTVGRKVTSPGRSPEQPHAPLKSTAEGTGCMATKRPETPPPMKGSRPVEGLASETAAPVPDALARQFPADARGQTIHRELRAQWHAAPASSEYNCTGNPFFLGSPGTYRKKASQPVLRACLPSATMNDAPRPLPAEPANTAPPVESPPESTVAEPPATEAVQQEKAPSEDAAKTTPQATPVPADTEPSEKYVVVIDPGHGGKDPGATSHDGKLKEKEVTLRIANRIKARLEKRLPGVTIALTRTDDTFLPVQERTAFANSLNADLFVSIHCNAAEDASSRGIETYYLSKASSKKAMAAAARENGIPAEHMSDIDATLLDLLMDSKKSESVKLAEAVHNALIHAVAETNALGRNRGVKRAPFYVLLGAKMPAILVECGFINGKERESLKESCFLDCLAEGVTDGISNYLRGLGDKG